MKNLIAALFVLSGLICRAQTAQKFNLDFDVYQPAKKLPEAWFQWGSYALTIDSTAVYSGKYAAKITSDEAGSTFGSIAYRIPAYYKGQSIQLEGYMKIKGVENGFAGLLLRVDGQGKSLVFDNMESQKVQGTKDWQKYTVTLPYPEGAEFIYVAGILVGKGEVWYDHFELTIDGESVQTLKETEKPAFRADLDTMFDAGSNITFPVLDATVIANLELLGRIWGFLKYYHPEVGAGNYNWDYELFRLLPEYLKARGAAERDQLLVRWIDKYGSLATCSTCKETSPDAFLKPDFSWLEKGNLSPELETRLRSIYKNRYQGKQYYIKMADQIGNPEFLNERAYTQMTYPDAGFRLLALYRYWNMIHYFFPYKHLMDKDWNRTLAEYIPVFLQANDELEYERAAVQIIGDIQDTHANLWGGGDKIYEAKGELYPPFQVKFVEGQLVVTDYYNFDFKEAAGLEIGDVITHINEKPVEQVVASLERYYPASNTPAKLRNLAQDILRHNQSTVSIRYTSGGQNLQKNLSLYSPDSLKFSEWFKRNAGDKSFKLLDGNIGYITLKNIKAEDIEAIKAAFKDTKGIIIDIRNYPSAFVPFLLGPYFVSSPTPFVKFTAANLDNPGEFIFKDLLEIPNAPETYPGKLMVLVNEQSQSQAEYTAMAFRAGDRTTVVGSTTAGADGNVSTIYLPGGLRTMISGIGVYYPDGRETQRVGIVPDVEVRPTIKGIREGRDEVLEKAIQLLEN